MESDWLETMSFLEQDTVTRLENRSQHEQQDNLMFADGLREKVCGRSSAVSVKIASFCERTWFLAMFTGDAPNSIKQQVVHLRRLVADRNMKNIHYY